MDKYIELKNINYKYNNGRIVFQDFSLKLNCEETTILTGENGSGKTTLTKLIMGILKPQSGDIFIFGKNSKKISLAEIGKILGYVFQYPDLQLFAASVLEELIFPEQFKKRDEKITLLKAEDLMRVFQLEDLKDSYPPLLSYGEKRRLAIASILMNDPKYLILDEPTSSLDQERIETLSLVLKKLKKKGVGSLIISHDKKFINENGERIIQLEGGRIISDAK